ncbi:hypothetical protein ACHHYP_16364 [Achlya hypogyna]|uniref:Core-binding (CB) domain-containing protein n=1 Tax=Achlya hypogyna TaxID=1202772 RepID=A0A1V9Y8U4_ACHHY|nr:hypothetical protein ACHHYP_16364 [Achlya hypogyna]
MSTRASADSADVFDRKNFTIEAARHLRIATSSRKTYESNRNQIKMWVRKVYNRPDLLEPCSLDEAKDGWTIDVDSFDCEDFLAFITWSVRAKDVTASTLSGYRSALMSLYKDQKVPLPTGYGDDIKEVYAGIRRSLATQDQSSSKTPNAKRPLTFDEYESLGRDSLALPDGGFTHLFLTMTWNLMCRSKSTETPEERPAKRQKGEKAKKKKHGTQSIRKGVVTYACSGSTGGPSVVSVCLRCGWSLGHVMERYFKYEQAGDQFVGRVVSGLPINGANFAIAPPHFVDNNNPTISMQVARIFPGLANSPSMVGIAHLLLASLVYHYDYLVSTLPPTHALLSSILFTDTTIRSSLAPLLAPLNDATMLVTGVPPNVEIYRNLKNLTLCAPPWLLFAPILPP